MSDDPFRQLTSIAFHRREKTSSDHRGWVVQANPTIAILWVAALGALATAGLMYVSQVPGAALALALAPLLVSASAAYHFHDERTFPMQLHPDGFQVGHDRIRWADVESLEATRIFVAGLNGTELQIEACGLVVRRSGQEPLCFPTLAELDAVEEVAHTLEQLRLRETGPLPADAVRVAALAKRQQARPLPIKPGGDGPDGV